MPVESDKIVSREGALTPHRLPSGSLAKIVLSEVIATDERVWVAQSETCTFARDA